MLSQNKRILAYLEDGNKISTFDAFTKFHVTRLASRIHDLRVAGYEINDEWAENEAGEKFKHYFLAQNYLKQEK